MNKTQIALRKLNGIVIPNGYAVRHICYIPPRSLVLTLQANIMKLGYTFDATLSHALNEFSDQEIIELSNELIPCLRHMAGDDVEYNPMYPNFPNQVMESSQLELFFNALRHYWSHGQWMPNYTKEDRPFAFENVKFKEIKVISEEDFNNILPTILKSADSISQEDKGIIEWFLDNHSPLIFPESIPFKENMCYLAGLLANKGYDAGSVVKTATDVLRILTAMSGGDVSLADNTKFKSLPKSVRRYWTTVLETVICAEDIQRHRNKWIRLFHNLHVGDFKKIAPKVFHVASMIRDGERIDTLDSVIEESIYYSDWEHLIKILEKRPGTFIRRLSKVLSLAKTQENQDEVVDSFKWALGDEDKVSMRVLLQLKGYLTARRWNIDKRFVFPKGNTQKAIKIDKPLDALSGTILSRLQAIVSSALQRKIAKSGNTIEGKVYVDPKLVGCPLPTQQRSASEGILQVARGTRMDIGDKNTLRFFIYWRGRDIDLSATYHDRKFNMIQKVSYTNLKSSGFNACHSGDITRAPNGASEFIDIDIDAALANGARYVAMNVLVYNGPNFSDHEVCYAGWMTRQHVQSNEIYSPETVEQKIDVRSNSKRCIPVIFDLQERKAIWVDIVGSSSTRYGGNNVESNRASIEEVVECFSDIRNKVNLMNLFCMYFDDSNRVETPEEADVVFITDRTWTASREGVRVVTPYDINTINSEFILD